MLVIASCKAVTSCSAYDNPTDPKEFTGISRMVEELSEIANLENFPTVLPYIVISLSPYIWFLINANANVTVVAEFNDTFALTNCFTVAVVANATTPL
jgi:hypothetical protein